MNYESSDAVRHMMMSQQQQQQQHVAAGDSLITSLVSLQAQYSFHPPRPGLAWPGPACPPCGPPGRAAAAAAAAGGSD